MAESFGDAGDPDYTIRIRADWSEFEDEVRQKQERSSTFAFEGRASQGAGRLALPDYSRAGPAADQFARAIERQVQSFERMTAITRTTPPIENINIPNRFTPAGFLSGPSNAFTRYGSSVYIPNNYGYGGVGGLPGGGVGALPPGGGGIGGGGAGGLPGGGMGALPPGTGGGGMAGGGGGGGYNYNWWSGNAGWVGPSRQPRQSGWYNWATFYAARVISEAVGNSANAFRQYEVNQGMSLGDPGKLAMADVNWRHQIESAIPFSIGKIAGFIRDPTGQEELSVTQTLAEAQMQDEGTRTRQRFMNQSRGLSQAAGLAGMTGTLRTLQQIKNEDTNSRISLGQQSQERYNVIFQEHMANRNRNRQSYWWLSDMSVGMLGINDNEDAAYEGRLRVLHQQIGQDVGNIDERTGKDSKLVQSQDLLAQRAIAASSTGGNLMGNAGWDLSEGGLTGRRSQLNTQYMERMIERSQMIATQRQEESEVALMNPTRVAATMAANNVALKAFDVGTARQMMAGLAEATRVEAVRDISTRGTVAGNALRAQFRPVEAANEEMGAERMAMWRGANPDDRDAVWQRETSKIDAYNAQIYRERGVQNRAYQNQIDVGSQVLARNPLAARMSQILGDQQIANMMMPKDAPAGLRTKMNEVFESQRKVAEQQYNDQRSLQTMDLKRQEKVTGILATAVGPGAPLRRMEAQVTNIKMEAEERAQAILREDVTNIGNADRERRIGANRLKAMKAEYLEGFSAQEGSLFRTNLSPTGASSSAEQVLGSIDQGIKELTNKLGALVAQE